MKENQIIKTVKIVLLFLSIILAIYTYSRANHNQIVREVSQKYQECKDNATLEYSNRWDVMCLANGWEKNCTIEDQPTKVLFQDRFENDKKACLEEYTLLISNIR